MPRLTTLLTTLLLLCSAAVPSFGLEPKKDAVFVRVVDVGAGECCVIRLPGKHNIIYDAGNYQDDGESAFNAISELIPEDEKIDLLVLSHTDSDHLGAVEQICDTYTVKQAIHSSMKRTSIYWRRAMDAIHEEADDEDCDDWNLAKKPIEEGQELPIDEAAGVKVELVCGFNKPPASFGKLDLSEKRNAGSVVLRIEYQGKSILFCGDAVGRHLGDPDNACIAEEKYMVDHAAQAPIASDVLVAPHHCADNGSSSRFVEAVHPKYVIFSAGHKFHHPRNVAAERYQKHDPDLKQILRTDIGDDEGGDEWGYGRHKGTVDPIGDDDIDIQISKDGDLEVAYRTPHELPE